MFKCEAGPDPDDRTNQSGIFWISKDDLHDNQAAVTVAKKTVIRWNIPSYILLNFSSLLIDLWTYKTRGDPGLGSSL